MQQISPKQSSQQVTKIATVENLSYHHFWKPLTFLLHLTSANFLYNDYQKPSIFNKIFLSSLEFKFTYHNTESKSVVLTMDFLSVSMLLFVIRNTWPEDQEVWPYISLLVNLG